MSMTTTSASSWSPIARATVAPTLPAPPTTVTFLFIARFVLIDGPTAVKRSWHGLHVDDDGVRELRCLELGGPFHLAGEVVGDFLLFDRALETGLDQIRGIRPAQIAEHHHAGQYDRARVDDVLARVLRRGAVRGFEEADLVADVGAGRHAEAADLGGTRVRQVIAVQIRRGEHVVVRRARQNLLKHAVGDAIVDENLAVAGGAAGDFLFGDHAVAEFLLRELVAPVTKRPFGEFHDVALVHKGHRLAAVVDRVLERHAHQALRAELRHRLHANAGIRTDALAHL